MVYRNRQEIGLDAVSDDNKRTKLGEVGRSIPSEGDVDSAINQETNNLT